MKVRAMSQSDCKAVDQVYQACFIRQTAHLDWIQCNFAAYPRALYFVAENEQGMLLLLRMSRECYGYRWTRRATKIIRTNPA